MTDSSAKRRKLIDRRIKLRRQRDAATTDDARERLLDKILVVGRKIAEINAQLEVPLRLYRG